MKKVIILLLVFSVFLSIGTSSFAGFEGNFEADEEIESNVAALDLDVESAILIESSSGRILYAKEEFKGAEPASVTKIMTLLLVCEELERGSFKLCDTVSVSAHAASMGGSQVFLEEGERITVEELIKSTVIASGNDSAVALAELCAGSEGEFVKRMNKKAVDLGLKNTSFENATGLDDTASSHYSCCADIAAMSRELIKHDIILKYSSLWQDSIRGGEFILTNTNRLVRYYDGCTGLKTGSTDKAGFCMSATAKRGNMHLIAVVMGAKTRDKRNEAARTLLDFGFANYALFEKSSEYLESAPIIGGVKDSLELYSSPISLVVEKSKLKEVEEIFDIPDSIVAPISKGASVGKILYKLDGLQIGFSEVICGDSVEKITLREIFVRILERIIG